MLPTRRTDLLVEHVGDELMVFDSREGVAHVLTPLAASVFELCDEPTMSEAQAAAHLDLSQQLVAQALDELTEASLLEVDPSRRLLMKGGLAAVGGVVMAPLLSSLLAPAASASVSVAGGTGGGGGLTPGTVITSGMTVPAGTNLRVVLSAGAGGDSIKGRAFHFDAAVASGGTVTFAAGTRANGGANAQGGTAGPANTQGGTGTLYGYAGGGSSIVQFGGTTVAVAGAGSGSSSNSNSSPFPPGQVGGAPVSSTSAIDSQAGGNGSGTGAGAGAGFPGGAGAASGQTAGGGGSAYRSLAGFTITAVVDDGANTVDGGSVSVTVL